MVWLGVPDDASIEPRELETVVLELHVDGALTAALTTALDAADVREARALALEILDLLESGELEPTAAAIEPIADQLQAPAGRSGRRESNPRN